MAEFRGMVEGLVSILMPCCGQLEYTKLSIRRILRYSRPPVELLLIEAGSLDGTEEYIQGIAAASPLPVEIFHSSQDSEFAELLSQAVSRTKGEYIAWVNNDVLVGSLWLNQLTALVAANPAIGIAGPVANLASEQQRVKDLPFRLKKPKPSSDGVPQKQLDTEPLDRFIQMHREANMSQWAEVERLGEICWLAKREVLDKVDLLEKGAEEGVFDGGRFSWRVRQAGFRLVCCRDLYVHHFGSNLVET